MCDGVGNASEHRYYRHIDYNIPWSEDLKLYVFDHAFELSMCIVVLHFKFCFVVWLTVLASFFLPSVCLIETRII